MNNKASFNVNFWTVIILVFFVPFWAFFLGPQLSYWGALTVANSPGMEGWEKLFWNNLNVLVFFALIVFVLVNGGED